MVVTAPHFKLPKLDLPDVAGHARYALLPRAPNTNEHRVASWLAKNSHDSAYVRDRIVEEYKLHLCGIHQVVVLEVFIECCLQLGNILDLAINTRPRNVGPEQHGRAVLHGVLGPF